MTVRATALVLLALAVPAAATAHAADLSVEYGTSDEVATELVAADGAAWLLGWNGSVARVSASGSLRRYGKTPYHGEALSRLTPLPDGGAALAAGNSTQPRTFRFRPDGTTRVTRLPPQAVGSQTAVVTPDGATWFAHSCSDRLWRVAPGGATRLLRLPRLGCDHVDEWNTPEQSQTLVRAGGGAVWLANACQGRVARAGANGRLLVRRVPSACIDDSDGRVVRTPALLESRGALRLPGVRIGPGGVVRRAAGAAVAPFSGPDGSGWTLSNDSLQVTVTRPGRAPQTIAFGSLGTPLRAAAFAPTRDGAVFVAVPAVTEGSAAKAATVRVGAIRSNGAVVTRPLPAWNDALDTSRLLVAAGSGDTAWVSQAVLRPTGDHGVTEVGRVVRVSLAAATTAKEQR